MVESNQRNKRENTKILVYSAYHVGFRNVRNGIEIRLILDVVSHNRHAETKLELIYENVPTFIWKMNSEYFDAKHPIIYHDRSNYFEETKIYLLLPLRWTNLFGTCPMTGSNLYSAANSILLGTLQFNLGRVGAGVSPRPNLLNLFLLLLKLPLSNMSSAAGSRAQ